MNVKVKLVALEVLSLLALSVIFIVTSILLSTNQVNIRMEETLRVAVEGFSGNTSYLRDKQEDIDITVFEGDTRVDSSIEGAVGTKASDTVIDLVLNKKETYFDTNVPVNGVPYYGYYMPTETGMLFAGKPRADITAFLRNFVMILLGIGCVAYMICVAVSVLFSSSIAKRIRQAAAHVDRLAHGDLSGEVPDTKTHSKDEVDIISHAVAHLHKELKAIITNISEQAVKLNSSNTDFSDYFSSIAKSVGFINTSVEGMAAGSASQAEETSSASQQVTDMADVIDNNSNSITELNHAVNQMRELSQLAEDTLSDLITINETTSTNIAAVFAQTNATNDSAEKIQTAVEFIQNITEQTNLLSLNASIEAARAGEAGKGFAVVAEEIRKLAEDSAKSASEIDLAVHELIDNSTVSVQTMNAVSKDSESEKEKLGHTQDSFQKLKSEVDTVYTVSKNIYEQTQRLESQKDTIHGAIEQLASISEENAASMQDTSSNMQALSNSIEQCQEQTKNLSELSDILQHHTNRFKL